MQSCNFLDYVGTGESDELESIVLFPGFFRQDVKSTTESLLSGADFSDSLFCSYFSNIVGTG
jgi:hypothetical protein